MGKVRRLQKPNSRNRSLVSSADQQTVVPLSTHCFSYDFIGNSGRTNIGEWIEQAAQAAGR